VSIYSEEIVTVDVVLFYIRVLLQIS